MPEKKCGKCREVKPIDAFDNCHRNRDDKQSQCRECKKEYVRQNRTRIRSNMRAYRERHGEELKRVERFRTIGAKYGLTMEQFDTLLASQNGACAACGSGEPGKGNWHVDHDHSCCATLPTCGDCICGILCGRCNRGMGMFEDNPDLLLAAAAYALRTRTKNGPQLQLQTAALQ